MDISKNIKAVREGKRITQSEIARKLGIEPTNYPRLEKRGNRLTIEQLEEIAGALGVGLLELLTGEPPAVADGGRVQELEARVRELRRIEIIWIEYQYELTESLVTAYCSFAEGYGVSDAIDNFSKLAEREQIKICVEFLSTITPFLSLFSTAEWRNFENDKDYKRVKIQLALCRYLVVYYQVDHDGDMPEVRGKIKLRAAEIKMDREKKANGEQ